MARFAILAAMAMTAVSAPGVAQMVGSAPAGVVKPYDRVDLENFYRYRLNLLRDEALERQAAEGGTLSAASKAEFQAKLDRINATRERDARRNDFMAIDGFGVVRR